MNVNFDSKEPIMAKETNKQKRLRLKRELVNFLGGKCKECGYENSLSALCFHHINPKAKKFNISGIRLTRMPKKDLVKEAKKCEIYCLNCHAELHDKEGWIHEKGKITPK